RLRQAAQTKPHAEQTDRDLIEEFARQGEQAAFARLIDRHGAMVRGVCRRGLQDIHEADDAFPATFLALARKAGEGPWQESLSCWLSTVALRVSRRARYRIGQRRRVRRLPRPLPRKGRLTSAGPNFSPYSTRNSSACPRNIGSP